MNNKYKSKEIDIDSMYKNSKALISNFQNKSDYFNEINEFKTKCLNDMSLLNTSTSKAVKRTSSSSRLTHVDVHVPTTNKLDKQRTNTTNNRYSMFESSSNYFGKLILFSFYIFYAFR